MLIRESQQRKKIIKKTQKERERKREPKINSTIFWRNETTTFIALVVMQDAQLKWNCRKLKSRNEKSGNKSRKQRKRSCSILTESECVELKYKYHGLNDAHLFAFCPRMLAISSYFSHEWSCMVWHDFFFISTNTHSYSNFLFAFDLMCSNQTEKNMKF